MCGVSERRLSVSLKQSGPIPLDVAFGCGAGEVLAIFGPSGSGKTTILRAIAGLYQPDRASVQSNGATWTDTTTGAFVPPHQRAAGFVFQEYALFPHLTAEGNVATALGHLPRADRPGRARQLLRSVRLEEKAQRRPQELSGGSASGWPSRGRWPGSRRCCCSTSHSPPSIATYGGVFRRRSPRCGGRSTCR